MSQQRPRRYKPYNNSGDDAGPDAKTRRIDAPATPEDQQSWQEAVNPGWRDSRTSRSAGTGRLPNQQAFFQWMQRGGWKVLAGIAGIAVVLLLFFLVSRTPADDPAIDGLQPTSMQPGLGGIDQTPGPILQTDPNAVVPTELPSIAPPQTTGGQLMAVTGTGTEGLFLRDQPTTGATILKTMPEGTQVEKLGEQDSEGRLWYQVRDPASGLEGWSAAEYFQPIQ